MRQPLAALGFLFALGEAAAHGALAVGQKTVDGTPLALVVNKASEEEAIARALRLCQRALATTERTRRVPCRIEFSFDNQCAAVASDKQETNIGWALGPTKADAVATAKLKCERAPDSGVKCFEHLSDCDT